MTYDNTNRGSIWPNQKKQKDTHPDFTGSLDVDGVEYWVSAWKRKPDANPKAPSLSFSVTPKEEVHAQGMAKTYAAAAPDDDFESDSIPF